VQRFIAPGSQDKSVVILALNSGTGAPVTDMDASTAGLELWYRRCGGAKVAITPADLASLDAAHSDGGLYHIGDGYYRLDPPDAAFAAGAEDVLVGGTATSVVIAAAMIQLDTLGAAIFDALMADHDTPSTIGAYLSRISTGRITVASNIDLDGNITLVPGHDYHAADNCALEWTNTGEDWPNLTGTTITFTVHGKLTVAGVCTNPGVNPQVVRVELTKTQTATLTRGRSRFKVTATVAAPSGHVVLLVYGMVTVADVVDAPAA